MLRLTCCCFLDSLYLSGRLPPRTVPECATSGFQTPLDDYHSYLMLLLCPQCAARFQNLPLFPFVSSLAVFFRQHEFQCFCNSALFWRSVSTTVFCLKSGRYNCVMLLLSLESHFFPHLKLHNKRVFICLSVTFDAWSESLSNFSNFFI